MDFKKLIGSIKAKVEQAQDTYDILTTPPRLTRLREEMVTNGVDAMIVKMISNVEYITGFHGLHDDENPHTAFITQDSAAFFTDFRYVEVAQTEAKGTTWTVTKQNHEGYEEINALGAEKDIKKIAVEDGISHKLFLEFTEKYADFEIIAAKSWIEKVRCQKDMVEVAAIQRAQAITDAAFDYIITILKPGMTEKEITAQLEFAMVQLGADCPAFSSIVAAGANGSLPHAHPSTYAVQEGDLVTMDFGAQYKGYKSDMTRTVCLGRATDQQRKVYSTVLSAQMAAIDAVKAGLSGVEIDKVARGIIKAAGFGENFGHGTGHGVGLDIHEKPNVSPRSKDTMRAGDVITIEPGIYLPGVLGVRIEDLVLVTKSGRHVFTQAPKELIEIEVSSREMSEESGFVNVAILTPEQAAKLGKPISEFAQPAPSQDAAVE